MALAVAALAGCKKQPAEAMLPFDEMAEMVKSSNPDTRYDGVKRLRDGAPKHTEAIPLLITALSDKDESVRWIATDVLCRFGAVAAEAVPKLTELLRDPKPLVRAGAAHALGTMGTAAIPALPALSMAATGDGNPEARAAASQAMRTIRRVKMFQDSTSSIDKGHAAN